MGNVNITINDKKVSVPAGSTILEAALKAEIRIPTLCNLKGIDARANCRLCIVEVEKSRTFQPACATKVSEGMVVRTDTPAIRKSRKMTLELLLSRHAVDCHHCMRIGSSKCDDLDPKFCEMCFFCDCVRDGFCELQALAREYKVDYLPFVIEANTEPLDTSTGSVSRNPNKCIKCCRCVDVCNDVQAVHNLCVVHRGSEIKILPEMGKSMAESPCVQCGRCADVCPTGAIFMLEHKDEMLYNTHKYGVTTVAQISANVLAQLAALFKLSTPQADIKTVTAGLRKIGVDYVVSDDFALAKAQAKAEKELEKRLASGTVILTNSYAAEKFVKRNFPQLTGNLLVYNSAQQEFGQYVKTTFADENKLDAKNIRTISITADNENSAEAAETDSVDFSVNARELYRVFMRTGANLARIRPTELDSFGTAEVKCDGLFSPVKWEMYSKINIKTFTVAGNPVQAVVATNLGQARELLTELAGSKSPYSIIRIIA
ncbi:NADP-reducing hydrogenase subunit HndD [Sporomusa acidovorans DSM 3132]|uniref:NADP-reducing hydrogenase subunit HndD n=1 Tax=Sporomusa acidovorans (strain ATCC 49682 / DSM 3132 / Mol) TaxID=1123286 RepID=A0ABZ3J0B6_SPOA4|nr:[Fe-Fe] hydrogenase large subunit C-terminal domain-containing protein [Sporomusa acidovorans]OZC13367.1 NADP-reducing hydrogenase subunit HndC [Sporomusa acidovorans DSM 3132]SDF53271.1 NADH-quinone oxidoreductase subunit G [Sporomusa acidovorans]